MGSGADRDAIAIGEGRVGHDRPGRGGRERRDGAALVAGRLLRLLLVGKREPADAEVRPQERPFDLPAAGDEDEDVVWAPRRITIVRIS